MMWKKNIIIHKKALNRRVQCLFFAVNFQNPYLFYQKIWKGAGIKPG